jgi:Thioredoxin-like
MQARGKALSMDRWLIVNVQDTREFASQQLNRDTWSDVVLQRIIKDKCVFWQVSCYSSNGQAFQQQYGLQSAPHTMIVDPRTGASLLTWEGFVPPERVRDDRMSPEEEAFCGVVDDSVSVSVRRSRVYVYLPLCVYVCVCMCVCVNVCFFSLFGCTCVCDCVLPLCDSLLL